MKNIIKTAVAIILFILIAINIDANSAMSLRIAGGITAAYVICKIMSNALDRA